MIDGFTPQPYPLWAVWPRPEAGPSGRKWVSGLVVGWVGTSADSLRPVVHDTRSDTPQAVEIYALDTEYKAARKLVKDMRKADELERDSEILDAVAAAAGPVA